MPQETVLEIENELNSDNSNFTSFFLKCYIWGITLYGAETWTLRAVDQKHLGSFEMWCWRRMEKIS